MLLPNGDAIVVDGDWNAGASSIPGNECMESLRVYMHFPSLRFKLVVVVSLLLSLVEDSVAILDEADDDNVWGFLIILEEIECCYCGDSVGSG